MTRSQAAEALGLVVSGAFRWTDDEEPGALPAGDLERDRRWADRP